MEPVRHKGKYRRIIRFYINSGTVFLNPLFYPEEIIKKVERKQLTLEDLLRLGDRAYIEVQAFGYDEFSGTRKLFQSDRLTKQDIHEGVFSKDSLSVKVKTIDMEKDVSDKQVESVIMSDSTN